MRGILCGRGEIKRKNGKKWRKSLILNGLRFPFGFPFFISVFVLENGKKRKTCGQLSGSLVGVRAGILSFFPSLSQLSVLPYTADCKVRHEDKLVGVRGHAFLFSFPYPSLFSTHPSLIPAFFCLTHGGSSLWVSWAVLPYIWICKVRL